MDAVNRFQFTLDARPADPATVAAYTDAMQRFDELVEIPIDGTRRSATLGRLIHEQVAVMRWFTERSRWAQGDRVLDFDALSGDPRLFDDLDTFMASRDLTAVETAFTRGYVSNPAAGEDVKGHSIVAAELGLASYRGPPVRDPASFDGDRSRPRRAEHLVARLAFVSTLFTLAGQSEVVLHRGMSFDGTVNWRPAGPFVSATFHRPIAEAQAALGPHRSAGVLISQRVTIDRLVMTYHETTAMNGPFREAEAVVLAAPTTVF